MNWTRPLVDETAIVQSLNSTQSAETILPTVVAELAKKARKEPVEQVYVFRDAFRIPEAKYLQKPNLTSLRFGAIGAGMVFGIAAFFSVFIFMFKGRTATFANLSNRLTSLVAGTASTVIFAIFFKGKFPKITDWLSLLYIFIAVIYLAVAERKRIAEMKAARELIEEKK